MKRWFAREEYSTEGHGVNVNTKLTVYKCGVVKLECPRLEK